MIHKQNLTYITFTQIGKNTRKELRLQNEIEKSSGIGKIDFPLGTYRYTKNGLRKRK